MTWLTALRRWLFPRPGDPCPVCGKPMELLGFGMAGGDIECPDWPHKEPTS
jgi:hypothetical protein